MLMVYRLHSVVMHEDVHVLRLCVCVDAECLCVCTCNVESLRFLGKSKLSRVLKIL